ncbi:hypothetical protein HALLA_06285 [Halostagnicola larsenii XH-48]|uniref:Uncharacterized protein n=1 Tax=Halostagnicola larsenii XH-48 TaxID=797299 RepID=W0JPV8_9EURY|nr:hypothetical protein HALLA_06285 [Halostagnicola larsenii XH-48]
MSTKQSYHRIRTCSTSSNGPLSADSRVVVR